MINKLQHRHAAVLYKAIGAVYVSLQFNRIRSISLPNFLQTFFRFGCCKKIMLLCAALSISIATELHSEIKKLYLEHRYPVIEAENHIWIGTPKGLYRYNPDDDTFKKYTLPSKDQEDEVKRLYYQDEWLWCILNNGLAALHIRLSEWMYYSKNNGMPSDTINAMDFLQDFIWIASDSGAARYDQLIEEWELYDEERGVQGKTVLDLLVQNERIWMITTEGLSEYEPQYEKWRHYKVREDSSVILDRMFQFEDEIWLVGNKGLISFHKQLQTIQTFDHTFLNYDNLLEIFIDNNRIWAITKMGVFVYENVSGFWSEFEGNSYLYSHNIMNGFVDPSEIWIITDDNVLVWNRSEKNWEILDYATGLSSSSFESIYVNGEMVFLLDQDMIDYRVTILDPWRKHTIKKGKGLMGEKWEAALKDLFDNEKGGIISLGKYKWSFEGSRLTYIYDYKNTLYDTGNSSNVNISSGHRLDAKSQIAFNKYKSIYGYYNNIDYSETMYGVRYGNRNSKLLREFNWGDFRREPGSVPFGENANIFGSNIWVQTGKKTPRFGRSLITAKALTGEKRSQKTYEYYLGAREEFHVLVRDIDYLHNQYYEIPVINSNEYVSDILVYVDDLNPSNNNSNTFQHKAIDGIVGDFDLWKGTEDYYYENNTLRFLKYVDPAWTIAVRYHSEGKEYESILQYDGIISTVLKNHYYLKGTNIFPYSFKLMIKDTTNTTVPLELFGLDDNYDKLVDSKWIDYHNGILSFPAETPFPPGVYDPDNPESFYTIEAQYQTELFLIQLEHSLLVRGSEILKLDGEIADAGNDYVLDYTNGTLVFVREGIVNETTRIEIEYEYYVDNEEDMHAAAVNWSPSDNLYLQGDWMTVNNAVDDEVNSKINLMTIHGEVRKSVGKYNIKIIPGVAYHPEENHLAANEFRGTLSSSILRFNTNYKNYSKSYKNIYQPQSILGNIKSNLELDATVDMRKDLRLSGKWNQVRGLGNRSNSYPTDRYGNISLLFNRQNIPAYQLSFSNIKTNNMKSKYKKHYYQNEMEYQIPKSLSHKIHLKEVKVEGLLRTGKQLSYSNSTLIENNYRQGHARLNALIDEGVQSSIFYRRNDMYDNSKHDRKRPISRSERLLIYMANEKWRVFQLNFRVENNVSSNYHKNIYLKNVNLNKYSQINLRLSPGRIWQKLSSLNFELNYNQTVSGWGVSDENAGKWIWKLIGHNNKSLNNINRTRNYYIKNEYRPSSKWYIYSMFEWNNQEREMGSSNLENHYKRWTEKLDLKLGLKTRINVQYRQFYRDQGYDRINQYFEPSTLLEHRWTKDFLNIAYLLYRYNQAKDLYILNDTQNWEARFDLILRKYKFVRLRRFEVRQSIAGTHSSTDGDNPERNYHLISSSTINIHPIHSMIFRLQFDLDKYVDELFSEHDYLNALFNIKVSFRF